MFPTDVNIIFNHYHKWSFLTIFIHQNWRWSNSGFLGFVTFIRSPQESTLLWEYLYICSMFCIQYKFKQRILLKKYVSNTISEYCSTPSYSHHHVWTYRKVHNHSSILSGANCQSHFQQFHHNLFYSNHCRCIVEIFPWAFNFSKIYISQVWRKNSICNSEKEYFVWLARQSPSSTYKASLFLLIK